MKDSNRGNSIENGPRGAADRDRLTYLRKRSLHRLWWSSARVALGRDQRNIPIRPPPSFHVSQPKDK